jgi:DNA-binding IclR family transcriptional regulator
MARGGLSATRATGIIDFLATRGMTAFTLSELARELEINVASCHAILQALTKSGHLSRHPKHKTYTLGPALIAIGNVALRNHELVARAEAAAAELSRTEDVEVLLAMRAGDTVLGLAHFQLNRVSKSLLRIGHRLPLQVPYGATFIAWESEVEIDRWINHGFRGKVDPQQAEELRSLLALIRERGYQISLTIDDHIIDLAGINARWEPTIYARGEPTSYTRGAAKKLEQLHEGFNRLFYDPLNAKDNEAHAVEFITAPLFDQHNRALYAITLNNFDRKLTPREIQFYLSKLLSMCQSIGRDF